MKVLVPGASGLLAREVIRDFVAGGHEVVGIDSRPWPDAPREVKIHVLDVRKRAAEEVFRRWRPDAVVHMATVTHLREKTEERYRINFGGTRAVFEHASAHGVRLVVFVGRHTFYGAAPDCPFITRRTNRRWPRMRSPSLPTWWQPTFTRAPPSGA